MLRPGVLRAAPLAAALAITAWGGLVRLDALVQAYGPLASPAWARALTEAAPRWAAPVKPASHQWRRVPQPYVGGDPINYLRFAREMETFYQPHVREPVFLAWTRGFLWLLDDADVAVSAASAAGSTLAVLASYLLASAVASSAAGLAVALLVAGEYHLITWGVDGWRDDTFMALVLLSAWGFVRLRARPSFGRALAAGTFAGLACLTRITALSFVIPALAVLVLDAPAPLRRQMIERAALAAGICAALLVPFLVSCAIATGDPFFAINYHTSYYRFAEGLPSGQPMSAASYLGHKLASHPVTALDTAFQGLTVQPFLTRFGGFEGYVPRLGAALAWASAAGLAAFAFVPAGRLLLVILVASLLPYAFTWNVSSGGEWRFTMHAYPLYLTAALFAVDRLVRGARHLAASGWRAGVPPRRVMAGMAAVACAAAVGWGLYVGLPWMVVREAILRGDDVSIETGPRDRVFFRRGWSGPHADGVMVRVSTRERATLRIPLPERRDYDLVVRMDPVAPERQRRVMLLVNGQVVAARPLGFDPVRMGAYRVRVPAAVVRAGSNELAVVADALVPAVEAGARFGWLDPSAGLGVRLWYVRILAQPGGHSSLG